MVQIYKDGVAPPNDTPELIIWVTGIAARAKPPYL